MPQLRMEWKNDGLPAQAVIMPEGTGFRTLDTVENGVDVWLDIVQYGLSKKPETYEYYEKSMLGKPCYTEKDCYILYCDGAPAATVTVVINEENADGNVHMVACKPEFRGRGFGKLMSVFAVGKLKERGMRTAYLTTDDWRVPAIKSYLDAGFFPVESDDDFKKRWAEIRRIISEGTKVPNERPVKTATETTGIILQNGRYKTMKTLSEHPVITVIGSGMMGSAITWPAAGNGCRIRLVGSPLDDKIIEHARKTNEHLTLKRPIPDGGKNYEYFYFSELDKALDGADLTICGVSSFGLEWYLENVIPRLHDGVPVLSISKGMYHLGEGKMISYPEKMEQRAAELGKEIDFMAVGGPCTSYELADHDPSCVTFCGRKPELLKAVRAWFEAPYYMVSLSTDVRGVECAVALKNAYALGISLAIGMSYKREGREFEHYNSQAALFGQAVKEMQKLLAECEGGADNITLGAGDLYVTVFGGRTRKLGILLGQGYSFKEAKEMLAGVTLESTAIAARTVEAVKALEALGKATPDEYPMLHHIGRLLDNETGIDVPWAAFESNKL